MLDFGKIFQKPFFMHPTELSFPDQRYERPPHLCGQVPAGHHQPEFTDTYQPADDDGFWSGCCGQENPSRSRDSTTVPDGPGATHGPSSRQPDQQIKQ